MAKSRRTDGQRTLPPTLPSNVNQHSPSATTLWLTTVAAILIARQRVAHTTMATPWSAPVQLAVATLAVLAALGSCAAITQQPNFVLMYTDDQDLLFDSLQALPWSAANIFAAGAAFSNFHAHTPVCCPSRSEMLTGRYFHNLRTGQAGDDGCMHVNTSDHFQQHLVFSRALKDAGYGTQMVRGGTESRRIGRVEREAVAGAIDSPCCMWGSPSPHALVSCRVRWASTSTAKA